MLRTGAVPADRTTLIPPRESLPAVRSAAMTATANATDSAVTSLIPIAFAPVLKTQVWGGRHLATRLGKPLPTSELYGEAWEISPLENAVSVAHSPLWAEASLEELWSRYPTWRGPQLQSAPQFPWLIKWLDCQDRLSVQVHPNAEMALRLTGRRQPKNEAWVVVHAEPTARIWAGCRPGTTAEELAQRLASGTVVECLHEFVPRAGDCISLPAGTLHAAGGGLLLAEVQQPSDITFRLFDWNRVGLDGRPRALHLEAGLASLRWPQPPVDPVSPTPLLDSSDGVRGERLLSTPEFQLDQWTVSSPWTRTTDEFAVWMVLHGRGQLACGGHIQDVSAGQTLWFPAVKGQTTWQPDGNETLVLLRITPPGQ
jgi:mannose-6-phosphate isomerase